jgi:hypothetical protein
VKSSVIAEKIAIYGLAFALFGLGLSIAAFLSGIADSGYAHPSWRTLIVGGSALWPTIVCGWVLVRVGIFDSLRSAGEAAPMLYTFGIPAIGWGLVGALIGYLRSKPRSMSPDVKANMPARRRQRNSMYF